jgi:hypothetical protein
MPAPPHEPPAPPTSAIHQQRQMAESSGVDSERYDRALPAYPVELVERVVAGRLGLA